MILIKHRICKMGCRIKRQPIFLTMKGIDISLQAYLQMPHGLTRYLCM